MTTGGLYVAADECHLVRPADISQISAHAAKRAGNAGGSGYGWVVAGIALELCRVRVVRRIPAVRRRRLTFVRLTPGVVAREAAVVPFRVGSDQLGDLALIEALAQAPRALRARSRGPYGAGERHGVAKPQVSSLRGVQVSGKYLQ